MKNPYVELMKQMRTQGAKYNPATIELGEVLSSTPLTIKVGDLQLNPNNLLVADYLLNNYSRNLLTNGTASNYITQDTLNKGDQVVLYKIDDTTYLVLARVVRP